MKGDAFGIEQRPSHRYGNLDVIGSIAYSDLTKTISENGIPLISIESGNHTDTRYEIRSTLVLRKLNI